MSITTRSDSFGIREPPVYADPYRNSGLHGNLLVFFFRGANPPLEVLSSLNISASDLHLLSAPNTTFSDLNATAYITDA